METRQSNAPSIDKHDCIKYFKEKNKYRKKLYEKVGIIIKEFEDSTDVKNYMTNGPLAFWGWLIYIKGKSGLFLIDNKDKKRDAEEQENLLRVIRPPSSYLPLLRLFQLHVDTPEALNKEDLQGILELYPPAYHAFQKPYYFTEIEVNNTENSLMFKVYDKDSGETPPEVISFATVDWEPFYQKVKIVKQNRFDEFIKRRIKKDPKESEKKQLEKLLGVKEGDIKEDIIVVQTEGEGFERGIKIEDLEVRFYLPQKMNPSEKDFVKEVVKKAENERENLVLRKNFRLSALEAAIAKIISRNMSHNIGSHVMPRTSIAMIDKRLEDAGIEKHTKVIRQVLKDRLDDYLQRKADFAAEIITEPLISTKRAKFVRDVLGYFLKNTLLIDNIARNEGLKYDDENNAVELLKQSPLVFHVYKDMEEQNYCFQNSLKNPFYIGHHKYNADIEEFTKSRTELSLIKNDVTIELPGPLGEFAFYNIFENLIRNTAKHNKISGEPIEIFINFNDIEGNRDLYEVEIWDSLTVQDEDFTWEVYEDGITKPDKGLDGWIRHCITKSIIDEKGNIRNRAWGIAEMKFMASLLRGSKKFLELESEENFKVKVREDNKLGYVFRVMKPKFLIGTIEKFSFSEDQNENLNEMGIYIYKSIDEMKKNLKKKNEGFAGFQFALFDLSSGGDKKDFGNILHRLPFRVVKIKNIPEYKTFLNCLKNVAEEKAPTDKEEPEVKKDHNYFLYQLEDRLYSKWLNDRWGEKQRTIFVCCGKDENDPYVQRWRQGSKRESELIEMKLLVGKMGEKSCQIEKDRGNGFVAFWDRHGAGKRKLDDESRKLVEAKDNFYVEIDKRSSDFVLMFSSDIPSPYLMAESALLKILVIDERVAERTAEKADNKDSKNRISMAREANVFILSHLNDKPLNKEVEKLTVNGTAYKISLEKSESLEEEYDYLLKEYHHPPPNDLGKMDIIIIHQGVLDNLKRVYNVDLPMDVFLEYLKKKATMGVVIESGRGIPPELLGGPLEKVKFFPFSLLDEFLLKPRIAKIRMTQLLMGLRRLSNEKNNGSGY